VFTLRCTKKLLDYFETEPVGNNSPATNLLGDWYATLFSSVAGDHVLFLNGSSLLNMAVQATDGIAATTVFFDKVEALFRLLDISNKAREIEFKEMGQFSLDAARNHSMNSFFGQFIWRYERTIEERGPIISDRLSDYEIQMNNLPIKKFGFSNPLEITRDLFLKSETYALTPKCQLTTKHYNTEVS